MHRWVIAAVVGLLSMGAAAQRAPAAARDEPEAEVRYLRKTIVPFDPAEVRGDVHGPGGDTIRARPTVKFAPRLPLRLSFRREMLSSVGEL